MVSSKASSYFSYVVTELSDFYYLEIFNISTQWAVYMFSTSKEIFFFIENYLVS